MKPNSQSKKYFEHKGKIINNGTDIANELNSFFDDIGPNIAKRLELSNQVAWCNSTTGDSGILYILIFLNEVTETDILYIVKKFKTKTSCDGDGIDMSIFYILFL